MNRRNFLARTTLFTAGAAGLLTNLGLANAATPAKKSRIRIIYALHGEKQAGPDWPNVGFNFGPEMERINSVLARRCKGCEFVSSMAKGKEEAEKILAEDNAAGSIDGYLVYQMNCWNRVVQTMATSGKPVLYADFQFGGSGGFLVYNAAFLRTGADNVGFVASSDIDDLVDAVNCFPRAGRGESFAAQVAETRLAATPGARRVKAKADDLQCLSPEECVRRLKETRILAVRDQNSADGGQLMGIQVQFIPFEELNQAWKNADPDEAKAVASRWEKSAGTVIDVTRETLETSAAMYLGQKSLLKKHGASGITVNCLGGFYGGHIHAYPCLGFHELLNEGLVGGCECDVRSAATMLTGTTLTQGRPGYISDPVIDTSKRQIIYAHCVAANKAFGPSGKANPFDIMTHSEDRQGASVRSYLPKGYMTTSLEFEQSRKEILFHRAVAVGNDEDDRACRTKICAEPVGDLEKLFRMWDQWSWHRVTFYGDLKEPIYGLADALGWKVVEEA